MVTFQLLRTVQNCNTCIRFHNRVPCLHHDIQQSITKILTFTSIALIASVCKSHYLLQLSNVRSLRHGIHWASSTREITFFYCVLVLEPRTSPSRQQSSLGKRRLHMFFLTRSCPLSSSSIPTFRQVTCDQFSLCVDVFPSLL